AGVHLRGDSFAAPRVRQLGHGSIVIGRSIHTAEAAGSQFTEGLDYVVLGTIFDSMSKPGLLQPLGVEELVRARATVALPLLAIGGITLANAGSVIRTGAGIASIGLFIPPRGTAIDAHISEVVDAVRRMFDSSGAVSYH